jgi:biotin carboxyl carrier protein
MKTRIFSIVFMLIAIALGAFLVLRIKETIDEEKRIKETEALIIKKLMLIRDAEKAYQSIYGQYTSNWDSLINFIENGQFPITKRTERIIELAYGADSVIVEIDTIEVIPARQYIFEKKHNVYAANYGTFGEFFVSPGQYVIKGTKIYSMMNNLTGKLVNQVAKETGRVGDMVSLREGDKLEKGQLLFTMTEELHDPNTDISQLAYIPFSDPPKKFEIYAEQIERNRLMVNVIEVRDIAPTNPQRSEENEANSKKPLRFGSRTEVTTAGNWE